MRDRRDRIRAITEFGQSASGYEGLNVLVTGADGFIGSHLTELLVRRGASVTAMCLYNSFDSHGWLDELPVDVHGEVKLLRGDVRDPAFVSRTMVRVDVVFHLAALIAIPHSYAAAQSYVDTNICGTLNVLEAARANDVMRIVHTSTSEVYGTALSVPISETHPLQGQSPYSATKIGADMLAEAYARSFDLPVTILRPFNTFGPRQSERAVIPTVMRQVLDPAAVSIRIGDTTPRRDFTYVEDTASAFLALGLCEQVVFGRAYNAGSGDAITVGDLIDMICALTRCSKPVEREDQRTRPEKSEVRALVADSTRLQEATGWHPTIGLREGLERTADWWSERLASGRVRSELSFAT
ncbi:SDR family NAD(P)-dependent oxidoreductase [Mesorhizobium sp.]|uniref:SDR family NAD(P)-dependent oxidoreductase n=1 Tax=Mesorhizobium sp. TaxID=1871066 RepID=UPI000FE88E19|nr:SDR family NAD(P)-dependent oxidoreductase [Mesorhizobium sp.]RWP23107.1 MAG: SDR family NAD(P)-dependent oxidoreductase [Mesorhizobium sp.]